MRRLRKRAPFRWLLMLGATYGATSSAAHAQATSNLVREAQAAYDSGRLSDAAHLYERALAAEPQNATVARGACRVALAREEAGAPNVSSRSSCHKALLLGTEAEDLRNEAASMLMPSNRPSLDDVAVTVLGAEGALRQAGGQPWGYLTTCDIARRLGNVATLEWCLGELQRVAPEHAVTKMALAAATERPSFAVWAMRVMFFLVLLATTIHALRRRLLARTVSRPLLTALGAGLCCLGASLGPGSAYAAEPLVKPRDVLGDIHIDEANPEASIPTLEQQNKQPLQFGYYLQDLIDHAEAAAKRSDHAASARCYKALTMAAPISAVGPRKWCEQAEATGDFPNAIIACRTAITNPGATSTDVARFVSVVLGSDKPLPALEEKELDNVLTHLETQTKPDVTTARLRCDVALRFHNTPALERCTSQLAAWAPNDAKTVSLQWALAVEKHDASAAKQLIARAGQLGMSEPGLARMEAVTRGLDRKRLLRLLAAVLAVVMMVVATRASLRWVGRRRGLRRGAY